MPKRLPLPYSTAATTYFDRIRPLGEAVFLDSGKPASERGRYDILAAAPLCSLWWNRGELGGTGLPFAIQTQDDPFAALEKLYQHYHDPSSAGTDLPFEGGFIGHFGYDLGRCIEVLPAQAEDDMQLPEMQVGLYSWCILIDHEQQCATFVQSDLISDAAIQPILQQIHDAAYSDHSFAGQSSSGQSSSTFRLNQPFQSNMDAANYRKSLEQIDEYILAGDCYQVNFAQRFSTEYTGDPWTAYKHLRTAAPTPFAAFLDYGDQSVLSLSPERFLHLDAERHVITQPIKGTRPRGKTTAEDQALADELANAEKDRTENIMIVDLLRNDISRSCKPHSVKEPSLFAIESYRNVHHLVSTVTGELKDHATPVSLLKHCFPGGSITGAPKIRAMEIIDELEPHRRNIYCGSIGYISLSGKMDTNITIRTLLAEQFGTAKSVNEQNGKLHCWAGGGIVADSVIEQEYQETFDKVNNLLNAL